jgi:hypothetical protein
LTPMRHPCPQTRIVDARADRGSMRRAVSADVPITFLAGTPGRRRESGCGMVARSRVCAERRDKRRRAIGLHDQDVLPVLRAAGDAGNHEALAMGQHGCIRRAAYECPLPHDLAVRN